MNLKNSNNDKAYDQKIKDDAERKLEWDELQKSIVMAGNVIIDMRTGEILGTYRKKRFNSVLYSL